jgi:hypothetical protein
MIIVAKAEVQGMQRVLEIKQAKAVVEAPSSRLESPRGNGLFGKRGSGVVEGDIPENSHSVVTSTMGTTESLK